MYWPIYGIVCFLYICWCSNALIHRCTLLISFVSLLLTFFKLTNAINYVGATYAIGSILMRKRNHLRNAIAISGTGCAYDFLYVIFYSSKSSSASVKFISFAVRLFAFLFEVLWTMSVYCYLKQQIALAAATELNRKKKKRVTWCDDHINVRPCRRVSLGPVKTFVKTGMDIVQSGAKSLQSAKPEVVKQLTKLKNAARPTRPTIADLLSTFGGTPRKSFVRPANSNRDVRRSFVATSAVADQPIAEAANANQPIARAAFVDQPIAKSANVDRSIARIAVLNQSIEGTTVVDQPIANVDLPITESANVDQLIAKSANVDRSIARTAILNQSIEGTTVVDQPIANVDLPITESVTAESATKASRPTAESGVVDQPIAELVTAETENKMTEFGRPDGTPRLVDFF